ncbi:MurR/RpiR family transcriptional regulator [Komagataeibacter oboediens]|uniref:MurR/RpiR family transcriptional regulator n=1 Tax=Komagataeibacter oboediens TaxID=65958 RepID=UPI001C2D72DC|nr:MurR/RpiR family transcriptional regulator [Komagataeibacter oboediens]MBV1825437.1 MurR/RpiR family transcriptional regulator [Komagataeibacter oboediens]
MQPPTSLPPHSPMAERIARVYPDLTQALRDLADFVVDEPINAARLSIHDIAAHVGVSTATANRLARALGFSGYAAFRAELIRSFESAFVPVDRLIRNLNGRSNALEVMAASLQEDVRNIEATMRGLSAEGCSNAVQAILTARRIYVVGMENGSHLAAMLSNGLDIYRDNIDSVGITGGGAGAARRVRRYGSKDLVIAVAFPRYMADTITVARDARAQGARVMAITDSPASPLAALTDLVLYVTAERQFAANSDASVLAMMEALCAAVAHSTRGAADSANKYTRTILRWLDMESRPGNPGGPKRATAQRK